MPTRWFHFCICAQTGRQLLNREFQINFTVYDLMHEYQIIPTFLWKTLRTYSEPLLHWIILLYSPALRCTADRDLYFEPVDAFTHFLFWKVEIIDNLSVRIPPSYSSLHARRPSQLRASRWLGTVDVFMSTIIGEVKGINWKYRRVWVDLNPKLMVLNIRTRTFWERIVLRRTL